MIEIRGIDGRIPLGFLAALGVHHLLTEHLDPLATLAWHDTRATPLLRAEPLHDLGSLSDWLRELVHNQPGDALIPGWPAGFPPPGAAPDRLRPTRDAFPALIAAHPDARRIIGSLVTDLAVKDDHRLRTTPMVAPTGKQSFHTMLRNQHQHVHADHHLLDEALTRWRRVSGAPAESFDHAAIISAADDSAGRPGERAVPGATWLAVAGLPRFRLAGDGKTRTHATLWRRIAGRNYMIWPLWTPQLDQPAITAMLEHPQLTPRMDQGQLTSPTHLTNLGVTRLCAAQRTGGNKSEGALIAVPIRNHN